MVWEGGSVGVGEASVRETGWCGVAGFFAEEFEGFTEGCEMLGVFFFGYLSGEAKGCA